MSRLKLTDAAVRRLRPPKRGQAEYFDELLPSFGLRLSYSGARSWIVMTRVHRKLRRITLGRYPATSLEDARKEARRVIELAQKGADPRTARKSQADRPVNFGPSTFGAVAEEFMSAYVGGRQLRSSTRREYQRILRGTDTAHLHGRPLDQITKFDVIGVLQAIRDRGSDGAAERALAYLGKFFSWCADRDYIDIPPTVRVKLDRAASSRDRVLTEEELTLVWRGIAAEGGLFGQLFQLLLLTGQRRGEIAGMQWSEIRNRNPIEAVWEIPGSRTKNRRPHLVPLSPGALNILNQVAFTGPLLFSTTGTTAVSGFGKVKARLDQWILTRKSDFPPWTLHDLRRTMVTTMNERLSVPPHVVEAVVNHISGDAKRGVAGVYNRALYLEERRAALASWSSYIEALAGERGSGPSRDESGDGQIERQKAG